MLDIDVAFSAVTIKGKRIPRRIKIGDGEHMPPKNIVMPPTKEIIRVCDLLDTAISRCMSAVSSAHERPPTTPGGAEFEVEIESNLLLALIIRYVEGVTTLAREDLVLLPGARVMARAAFEVAIQIRWMLAPDDWFDRETRWLVRLKEEESYYERLINAFKQYDGDIGTKTGWADRLQSLHGFRTGIEAAVPPKYKSQPFRDRLPDVHSMLRSIGDEWRYPLYIETSQYVHGTQIATRLYRHHLGNKKELGEYIRVEDWSSCFYLCWYALAAPSQDFISAIGGDPRDFASENFLGQMQEAVDALQDSAVQEGQHS
jgi:hypothetical protein